jgi:hypothetical protein
MITKLILMASLALVGAAAQAAEAGKIIFVAGAVQIDNKPAALGAPVGEGELLVTGGDGYLYIKTIDNGLFILRPSTKARIAAYHVDKVNPANTRVKLELLSGVARSQSGEAVKQARQNFRFNTPVAAIGVRGTDFTVFTDQETSRVTVISGGITVSGFGGGCHQDGSGPCEGGSARELSAAQKGQLLQVRRGQAPQLLQGNGALAPDVVAPPRADEPGKGGLTNTDPSLDPRKSESLQGQQVATQNQQQPTVDKPPTVITPVEPPVVTQPPREVSWGRWAAVMGEPGTSGVSKAGAERIAMNDYFVLFRSQDGEKFVAPQTGSVGFQMASSTAYVRDRENMVESVAKLSNGQLNFNFDQSTFATQFDLLSQAQTYKFGASGLLNADGVFYSLNKNIPGANMEVTGVINSLKSATYIFQGSLDNSRVVSGVTSWAK